MKNRLIYLDYVSAIMICVVMWMHINVAFPCTSKLYASCTQILFMYMPWFFFKSGMFASNSGTFGAYFRKNVKKLIVPWCAFAVIGHAIYGMLLLCGGDLHINYLYFVIDLIKDGSIYTNGPVWFLLTLFFVKVIFKLLPYNYVLYVCIILLCSVFSYLCYFFEINRPPYIANTLLGLIFFLGGKCLATIQYNKRFFICSVSIFLVINIFCSSKVVFVENRLCEGNYFVYIISAFCGILSINNIVKRICFRSSFISKFGENSMKYLVCHFPVILIVSYIAKIIEYSNDGVLFFVSWLGIFTFVPIVDVLFQKFRLNSLWGNDRKTE